MTTWLPYTADMPTGYFVQNDIYMTYTEYYGDGTVYGLRHIHFPDGTLGYGLGPGMSRADLVAKGMIVPEERASAVPIDLVVVAEHEPVQPLTTELDVPKVELEHVQPPSTETDTDTLHTTALSTTCSSSCICVSDAEKTLQQVVIKINSVKVILTTTINKEVKVHVDDKTSTIEFIL
jgi:hypothetical protein